MAIFSNRRALGNRFLHMMDGANEVGQGGHHIRRQRLAAEVCDEVADSLPKRQKPLISIPVHRLPRHGRQACFGAREGKLHHPLDFQHQPAQRQRRHRRQRGVQMRRAAQGFLRPGIALLQPGDQAAGKWPDQNHSQYIEQRVEDRQRQRFILAVCHREISQPVACIHQGVKQKEGNKP